MRIVRLVGGALALALLGVGAVAGWTWWRSEAHLGSFPAPPRFAAAIPTDAASIAYGAHLAVTRGCTSCHGAKLEGARFYEQPGVVRAVASNLATLARRVDAATLEAAIRHGIGHDGRALYSMPSYNFVRMSDADVAALIAYLRSVPPVEVPLPTPYLGWKTRWALARGEDGAIPAFLNQVPALEFQQDPDPAVRAGEYLAMTSCNECHGFGLRGDSPFDAGNPDAPPDLVIAAAYDPNDFRTLMRTGRAAGNRELRMMSGVARARYAHWTDDEIAALHRFFQAMAARQ